MLLYKWTCKDHLGFTFIDLVGAHQNFIVSHECGRKLLQEIHTLDLLLLKQAIMSLNYLPPIRLMKASSVPLNNTGCLTLLLVMLFKMCRLCKAIGFRFCTF